MKTRAPALIALAVAACAPAMSPSLPIQPVNKVESANPSTVGMSDALGATLDSIVAVGLRSMPHPVRLSPSDDMGDSFTSKPMAVSIRRLHRRQLM